MKKINIIITMLLLSISVISQTAPYVTTTGTQTLTNKTYSNSILSGSVTVNQATVNTIPYFDGSKNLKSVVLGSGLSLSSGTLSSSSSSTVTPTYVAYGSSTGSLTSSVNFQTQVGASRNVFAIGHNISGNIINLNPTQNDSLHAFEVVLNNQLASSNMQSLRFSSYGDGYQNNVHWCRYRGTPTSPTSITSGDFLMSMGYRGQFASGTSTANVSGSQAAFQCVASENWSGAAQGTKFIFSTTANGSAGTANRKTMLEITGSEVNIGSDAATVTGKQFNINKNYDGATGATISNTSTATGAFTQFVMGQGANSWFNIVRGNSATTGNVTGTSIPLADNVWIYNKNVAAIGTAPITVSTLTLALLSGTASANAAVRLDATGLRICTNSTAHTANTVAFEMNDAMNMKFGTTTGTKIGTATTQKIGFFNATPVVQQTATTDLGTVLSNLGLRASGTAYPISTSGVIASTSKTNGIGYAVGSGSTVTQATSRTTGVTINAITGAITLVSAAGSATYQSFTVTNSAVTAKDVIIVNQQTGTDLYEVFVTAVAAGSFIISFATTGGTTTETPIFNFAVIKGQTN